MKYIKQFILLNEKLTSRKDAMTARDIEDVKRKIMDAFFTISYFRTPG